MAIDRVVIVGTSVAGVRAAQALRAGGYGGEVILIGAESVDPYDKPPLSKDFLAGEKDEADIALLGRKGWAGEDLVPMLGRAAASLDPARKSVVLDDGERIAYDAVVVATGARARELVRANGTIAAGSIRTLDDSRRLRTLMARGGPVVVVGGGFVGAEAAATARQLGCETTIVEALPVPFARVLGPRVGELIAALHADNGVTVRVGTAVEGVDQLGEDRHRVRLADGSALEASVVVAGIGVIPNTDWLTGSGLSLDDGVVTDEYCRAKGVDGVHAIGDVARWWHPSSGEYRRVEHWTNAVDQANLVAHNILHPSERRAYAPAPYFWSDQHGTKLQMVGDVSPGETVEVHDFPVPTGVHRVAIYSSGGRMTAAVTLGWPRAMASLRRLWSQQTPVAAALAELEMLAAKLAPSRPDPIDPDPINPEPILASAAGRKDF